jgi:hypothetical protein
VLGPIRASTAIASIIKRNAASVMFVWLGPIWLQTR